MSTLNTNDAWVIVVRMRPNIVPKIKKDELVIVLDSINDPGNLGTIIRIADWYGISHIIASLDTVDMYNSKVLMATMWSFSRVSIYYTNIDQYLSKNEWKIYWAYLNGENVHSKKFTIEQTHLVIGSEAHGISPNIEKYITDKITIPRFGLAESLNAGVATAIIVDRVIGARMDIKN
jgi:TrmH family RNA methyltransferase